VGGLFPANLNKITDANLLEEIIGHDIILLTETHLGKDENIVPHGYKSLVVQACIFHYLNTR
jgi:hypothetical protein